MDQGIKRKFNQACVDYHLLEDGDRILVGLSGGKDSLLLTALLAERSRIFKPKIEVEAAHVIMDNIPYDMDKTWMQEFCDNIGIKLHILHTSFDESTDKRKTRCFLCSWNRRKALFSFATSEGFNKVALGHHQDDILTTWLMNITLEGNPRPSMLPMVKMENYPISIIRPLCLLQERRINEYAQSEGLVHEKAPCPWDRKTSRTAISNIFRQMEALNPEIRYNMWNALTEQAKLVTARIKESYNLVVSKLPKSERCKYQ